MDPQNLNKSEQRSSVIDAALIQPPSVADFANWTGPIDRPRPESVRLTRDVDRGMGFRSIQCLGSVSIGRRLLSVGLVCCWESAMARGCVHGCLDRMPRRPATDRRGQGRVHQHPCFITMCFGVGSPGFVDSIDRDSDGGGGRPGGIEELADDSTRRGGLLTRSNAVPLPLRTHTQARPTKQRGREGQARRSLSVRLCRWPAFGAEAREETTTPGHDSSRNKDGRAPTTEGQRCLQQRQQQQRP